MLTDEEKKSYDKKGYFVVDDAIEPDMFAELRAGEEGVYTDFRGEGEPYHIVGLISREYAEPFFGQYLAAPTMLYDVKAQIGDELRMSSMAIFTNPHGKPFHMGWHRDIGGGERDLPEEAELEFLRHPRTECRWEALVEDDALALVPGSQHRYRTEQEWDVMRNGKNQHLPAEKEIHLRAGQTIFWNGKIIHRSTTQPDRERLTLIAGSSVHRRDDEKREIGRFGWMMHEEVRANLPESLHLYYDRWKALHS